MGDERVRIPIAVPLEEPHGPVNRDDLVRELTIQRKGETANGFNLNFLAALENRPDDPIAEVWEDVERVAVERVGGGTKMRPNPYIEDEPSE